MQDPKNSPKIAIWAPSHNIVGLYLRNYGTYRQSEKNLLSSNISSRCPHNMVNFGLLTADIVSLVWGTPANFNGFRVLAALLHGTLVVGVSQTASLNRGRHLYSAGRPSRWALAHISSWSLEQSLQQNVIDAAINEWRKQQRACMHEDGQHFEHLLRTRLWLN